MPKVKFTIQEELFDAVPSPRPASKLIPEWYRKIDKNFDEVHNGVNWNVVMDGGLKKFNTAKTIKACLPVRDYLTSGYIIPAWTDITILRDDNDKYGSLEPFEREFTEGHLVGVEWHHKKQFTGSPFEKTSDGEKIVKIVNPWCIRTPKGYSSFIFSPFYHQNKIEIMPAIVDTDTMESPINLPAILKDKEAIVERGTPLVQIMPFKREEWSHDVSKNPENLFRKIQMQIKLAMGSIYTRENWQRKFYR